MKKFIPYGVAFAAGYLVFKWWKAQQVYIPPSGIAPVSGVGPIITHDLTGTGPSAQ